MRRHDQAIDLLVAIVGEREHRPIAAGFARPHLDATDDAVGARRGRDLHAVAVGMLKLDRVGEIDRRRVETHIDRLDRGRGRDPEEGCEREGGQRRGDATRYQAKTSSAAASAGRASTIPNSPLRHCNRLYAEFAAHFYAAHPVKPAQTGMSIACDTRPQGNYAVFSKGQNDLAEVRMSFSREWQLRLLGSRHLRRVRTR